MDRKYMFMEKNLTPGGCLPLPWGYIHVYDHNIQTSTSLKPQCSPNLSDRLTCQTKTSLGQTKILQYRTECPVKNLAKHFANIFLVR